MTLTFANAMIGVGRSDKSMLGDIFSMQMKRDDDDNDDDDSVIDDFYEPNDHQDAIALTSKDISRVCCSADAYKGWMM